MEVMKLMAKMMKYKKLRDYIKFLEDRKLIHNLEGIKDDIEIKYLSYNSKDVEEGTLFICKGLNFKEEYLEDAKRAGAVAYICEEGSKFSEDCNIELPRIVVKDMRTVMSEIGEFFFDGVWNEKVTMVGITGTKGKSTTATFVKAIMDNYYSSKSEKPMGFLSGIYNFDGKTKESSKKMTTLETIELHKHLSACVENGLKSLVMETSSQALKYMRTSALKYKVGAFLNVSEDHISDREHADFEDYFQSKLLLFKQCEKACINMDLEENLYNRIAEEANKYCKDVVTFGHKEEAQYYGYDVESTPNKLHFKLRYGKDVYDIEVSIGGYYNSANALAAIAITHTLGVPFENIKAGLKNVKVEGRMELYHLENKDVDVIIDYAHNRISYETLFTNIDKLYPGRKKLLVFGVHGNKAYNRRQDLGEMAQKYADQVVLTEQDIGTDDLKQIWTDILDFLDKSKVLGMIENRREAILFACEKAEANTVMVVAGNGADRFQKRGLVCMPEPTDGEIVQEYIASHK